MALGRAQWVSGASGVALASSLSGPGVAALTSPPRPRTPSLYGFFLELHLCEILKLFSTHSFSINFSLLPKLLTAERLYFDISKSAFIGISGIFFDL